MAIDYASILTGDQKRALIEQRVQQFAAEAYQHELNKQIAITIGDETSVAQADAALATLEIAINTYQAEAASLQTPAAEA